MYEQFDLFLTDYAIEDSGVLNYWYDSAYEDAMEMMENFTEEDWQKLLKDIETKSNLWKERLAYILSDKTNPYQIKVIRELLKTDNDELLVKTLETIKTDFDLKDFTYEEKLKNKIKELQQTGNAVTKDITTKFEGQLIGQDLKIFTDYIEPSAKEQIEKLLSQEAFKKSKIRIMPDVHAGNSCVIGFTGDLGEKVIPSIVGEDIGCGMFCLNLGKIDIDFVKLDEYINNNIPNGNEVNGEKIVNFDLSQLYCYKELRGIEFLEKSIGSLGGGNHFIEIDESTEGDKYLIIHTGSRNLGKQIANFYQKLAYRLCNFKDEEYKEKREQLVKQYKEENRLQELQQALEELRVQIASKKGQIPYEYSYLEGKYREAYLHDMKICQEYAALNRMIIARRIADYMGWKLDDYFESVHNYISFEDNIVRKGSISAREGERVIIPINMRDGCIIGIGKGNPDWNYSAPHGAGRTMSRKEANEKINLDEYKEAMSKVYTTSVNMGTLDEAPFAYKPIEKILEFIQPTVNVTQITKPVYNFKATNKQLLKENEQEKRL